MRCHTSQYMRKAGLRIAFSVPFSFSILLANAQTTIDRTTLQSRFKSADVKKLSATSELIQLTPQLAMSVEYVNNNQVCIVEIQGKNASAEDREKVAQTVMAGLNRGKHLNDLQQWVGIGGATYSYYEHVVIVTELFTARAKASGSGPDIYFKSKSCHNPIAQAPF